MFYVIDGRKLWVLILIIVLLIIAAWVAIAAVSREGTPILDRLVFLRQFIGGAPADTETGGRIAVTPVEESSPTGGTAREDDESGEAEEEQIEMSAITVTSDELAAAGQTNGVAEITPVGSADQFAEFRLERERTRSQQIAYLQELIETADDETEKSEARKYLTDLLHYSELESTIEGLVKARGFSDAIAVVSDSGVSILVRDTLTREEAAQIGDLAARVAGTTPAQVKLIDGVQ